MTDEYQQPMTAADVAVGDTSPAFEIENVERKDFVRYAGASGDFNPIHFDEPYAKESGYESVFGQGMLTAGYAAHMVSDWLGLMNIIRFRTRFKAQVFPGDSVVITGEISQITPEENAVSVIAEFEAATRDGKTLITGEAEAELPNPGPEG